MLERIAIVAVLAAFSGCYGAHDRFAHEDATDAAGASPLDGASDLLCPDADLEIDAPEVGCVSFAVAPGTPARLPDAVPCRALPGYRLRIRSSSRVGLSLTLDHEPSCGASECIAGFSRMDPSNGCSIDSCAYGGPSPIRIDGPRSAIVELFIYPIAPGDGPLAGSVCASP